MYPEFLKALSEIAEALTVAVKVGGSTDNMLPLPYISGSVNVHLEGELVGYFDFEDDYVTYREAPRATSSG